MHVRTEELIEVSGHQVKHTIQQVTKTSFDREDEQPQVSEQDTSQVSVSSLPEDEKSEPTTATVSSTTSTTTGDGGAASAQVTVEATGAGAANMTVTIEQKGKTDLFPIFTSIPLLDFQFLILIRFSLELPYYSCRSR